ncbi:hypothetical protein [Candidatus Poriferisodalis sp.]|uniref:hypothetical protein n=1 Tax=Candidatus Poriferisodalis sp. TaxID=3101277 RepID=UPI003B528F44
MSARAETMTAPKEKSNSRRWMLIFWAGVVVLNVAHRLLEWQNVSRWVLTVPFTAVACCIVVYRLLKRRREAARDAAIRG